MITLYKQLLGYLIIWNYHQLNLDTGSLIFVVTLPEQVTFERFQRIFVLLIRKTVHS